MVDLGYPILYYKTVLGLQNARRIVYSSIELLQNDWFAPLSNADFLQNDGSQWQILGGIMRHGTSYK